MSGTLENVLAASGQPALDELRLALRLALDGAEASINGVEEHTLKSRVYRLRFHTGGVARTVVVKRLETTVARRCERLARRWLPAVGLASMAPRLIAASEPVAGWVWHVYEDLGENTLERRPEGDRVEAALRTIARLHVRFASHALLDECRTATDDLGLAYWTGNVRDAIHALEALSGHAALSASEPRAVRERLLERLTRLDAETPARARALADAGTPPTLLHGDLWTSNVFVSPTPAGLEARLLDWDRTGVGPPSYDLSTFLLRFPGVRRACILEYYDRAVVAEGGRPLARGPLAMNLETAELARYANRVIWPARAIAEGNPGWGVGELAEVERWFEALEPVMGVPATVAPVASRRSRALELPAGAKLLIVNADDFGSTTGVNRGILEAHARGIVTSTSLMVEAPAAREAALASREAPALGIGLHVDLGRTPPADADGVRRLLLRQAERFELLMGRTPTHLDSHRNAHLDPVALPEFVALAQRLGIPLRGHSRVQLLPSFYGQWHGESHPEQVGVESLLRLIATRLEPGITELICHPAYVDAALESSYRLEREVERETLCHPDVQRALDAHGILLAGFADVSRLLAG
jgi:predicted glycoside hydrolase/deacetylase ChbG (UPF0249 family)/aminoglycoside phosphotransferase (APT) family kinase protein